MPTDDPALLADAVARRLTAEAAAADGQADSSPTGLHHVCRATAQALAVAGCALHLLLEDGSPGVVTLSGPAVAPLADLAFTVGEGPTLDAFTLRRPVLAGDLGQHAARWPGFTQAAEDVGVRGVLSFPLQVGGMTLGVLDLYATRPRSLDDRETALALAFADLATSMVLDGPVGGTNRAREPLLDHHAEVHQAQGMVMVDLRVDLREALVRMRAHAFREGIPLIAVARSILQGVRLPAAGND